MEAKRPNHALSPMRCPARLEDVDLFSPGAPEHWYEAYDILHAQAPVHRIPGEGFEPGTDAFILSKHEDIARVVRDEERYPVVGSLLLKQVLANGEPPYDQPGVGAITASMASLRPNPKLWRARRQELTDPWVGPGAGRNEAMIKRVAHELIDRWIDRGEVEFVSEFAQPMPQMVMANILGWPLSDLKLLKHFGDGTVKPFVFGRKHNNLLNEEEIKAQQAVLEEFKQYTDELIDEKRRNPQEDMISFLTEVEYSPLARKLTNLEINGIVYAMVIGGLETTQYALAEQAQLLIERDGIWNHIQSDRAKMRAFIEEGMRLRSPTQGLSTRVTSQDEVFQGVMVAKGSYLHLRWAAANIDPDEWRCPQELRLDRKAGTRHLVFSQGPRVCPGTHLSRIEQLAAWNALCDRIDRFEYGDGNRFMHQPGIMLGTLELNLRFAALR
ncbi:MAG: cytochrome P450 [Gammaproteobacteria bacterium]|nr:cytochrome P450 [Gammaproteobacteria bacterium]